jgi:outer membrane protein assembly factor BamB
MFTRRPLAFLLLTAAAALPPALFAATPTADLAAAVAVDLPNAPDLTPAAFKTPDGKEGWVVKISAEAIPTPAYANKRIFTGGGIHSQKFLALDASTGKIIWNVPTQDNGPTSPVASGNSVAYNSESCHTEVRDYASGKLLWSEVTGGTLLTQPLILDNALLVPHPIMARNKNGDNSFRMLAVDLKNYKHAWDIDMSGDVLSAPVAANGGIFFTCTDGQVFANSLSNGENQWTASEAKATSAPAVSAGVLAVTAETSVDGKTMVGIRFYDANTGDPKEGPMIALTTVNGATDNTVRNGWDYQGPKIAATKTHFFNAPGNTVNAVAIREATVAWRTTVKADGMTNAAGTLTPPALGKENVYLGSSAGHIFALKQADGTLAYSYKLSTRLITQPILAEGNLFLGTADGRLVCLKLNHKDAADWTAWGGNAMHNKID